MRYALTILVLASLNASLLSQDATKPTKLSTELVWPTLAPGETQSNRGEHLPTNPQEQPPITRIINIRTPTIDIYPPSAEANGSAVLVLPGGGFGKVVPDLEGCEAATFMGKLGVTTFVLNYRTSEVTPKDEPKWKRPLQDGQRAMRWIRSNSDKWKLDRERIGLLAFSAGGQVGSILITSKSAAYDDIDELDKLSFRPDFAMLVYPWNCYVAKTDNLLPEIKVDETTPPTFIVHTHDDNSTSLGAALIYADMKRKGVPAELHIYGTGGHGYGTRPRPNSNIGTWKDRATDWLKRKL